MTETGEVLERDGTPALGPPLAECRAILENITSLQTEKKRLQSQLQTASPGEKPELIGRIRELTTSIAKKNQAYQACRRRRKYPIRADLVSGVLASAAIAALFRPVVIQGETYVDGGFRQVAPAEPAFNFGADRIYIVIPSNTGSSDIGESFANRPALDLIARALSNITIDEITHDDLHPLGGWGQRHVAIIGPDLSRERHGINELHGIQDIDPGLIRIAMAYGYMRAADVLDGVPVDSRLWDLCNATVKSPTQNLELGVAAARQVADGADGGQFVASTGDSAS